MIKRPLLAVLLNAGRAQAGKAMLVDRILPREEFLDRQRIAAARFFERQQAAAHGVTIGFWEYLRIGAPLTLVTITLGLWWL